MMSLQCASRNMSTEVYQAASEDETMHDYWPVYQSMPNEVRKWWQSGLDKGACNP
jgi:hypothetical protein